LAAEILELSRSRVQSLVVGGCVRVNSLIITDPCYYLRFGDRILLENNLTEEKPDLAADSSVPFSILYEDEDLLVIDKPSGVTVHPGAGNHSHTLVNGLVHHCGASLSSSSCYRPGIVHRLDKDTSGILVVAKNDFSHGQLAKQFLVHSIKRKYLCFCYGVLQPPSGKIETLIARDRNNRLKMAVVPENGRRAITFYKTLKTFSTFISKIECELKTGRTHQIRVQLSQRKCSLLGDTLYKAKNYAIPKEIADFVNNFPRQALHAYFLEFSHPRSEKMLVFESNFPADMLLLEKTVSKIQS
jgi:23S rRNA pseudouridine1911/1915/1917 synthase